tara:strand:+ start:17545 stop:17940 length:396 start_codon:yes stop_codon:yes gene_type:complete
MKILNTLVLTLLISLLSEAMATSDAGFESKKVAQCGPYSLLQYKYAVGFGRGIIHFENRYELEGATLKESVNLEFKSHSEGADLEGIEIYEYNPKTGAAIKYRKLSIHSWGKLFYMDVLENDGSKSRIECN